MAKLTRKKASCDIIGPSAELPVGELPTLRDLLACGNLLKERSPELTDNEIMRILMEKLICIHKRVNSYLPLMQDKSILNKIKRYWHDYKAWKQKNSYDPKKRNS